MNNIQKFGICVLLICPLLQCSAYQTGSNHVSDSKMPIKQNDSLIASDTLDCLHLVTYIVGSSSFNSEDANKDIDKSKEIVYIDNITSGIILIKVVYKGTPGKDTGPNNGSEFPIGWLQLDLNKSELRDITRDPDSPVLLRFDNTLIPMLKRICNK
jgi:hypothetical protein